MSYEVKFRVWNGNSIIDDYVIGCSVSLNDLFKRTGYTFMRYTGLKDKNGNEIYEGDILSIISHDTCSFKDDSNKKQFYGVVGWVYGTWYFVKTNYKYTSPTNSLYHDSKYFEISGNIYNNPELLEVIE